MLVDACAACIMIFWYRAATSISTSHWEPFATTTLKSAASVSVGDELSKATDVGTGKNEGAAGAALALTSAMARHTKVIGQMGRDTPSQLHMKLGKLQSRRPRRAGPGAVLKIHFGSPKFLRRYPLPA